MRSQSVSVSTGGVGTSLGHVHGFSHGAMSVSPSFSQFLPVLSVLLVFSSQPWHSQAGAVGAARCHPHLTGDTVGQESTAEPSPAPSRAAGTTINTRIRLCLLLALEEGQAEQSRDVLQGARSSPNVLWSVTSMVTQCTQCPCRNPLWILKGNFNFTIRSRFYKSSELQGPLKNLRYFPPLNQD